MADKQQDFKVPATFNPELLVWARLNEGMTLAEAADATGIPGHELRSYERGGELPCWSTIQKIAQAYRRPSAVFLREKTPKDPRRRLVRVTHHYSDGTEEIFWEEENDQA